MSICVGVANKARRVTQMYVGVNGKARHIKKVYIGVNNKACLVYNSLAQIIKEVPAVVGGVCNWAGYNWTVVHVTSNLIYMILTNIYSMTTFGVTTQYAVSNLVPLCTNFLNTIPASYRNALADVTVNGVTQKVFVPAAGMCCNDSLRPYSGSNGTNNYKLPRPSSGLVRDGRGDGTTAYPIFDLFNYPYGDWCDNRIAYYNGNNTTWWTSTASHAECVWATSGSDRVKSVGQLLTSGVGDEIKGFRPCIAVKRKV